MGIEFIGDEQTWKLVAKATSEVWEKTTRALEIHSVGCVVQVSTVDESGTTKAMTFVPGVKLERLEDDLFKIVPMY